MHRQQKQINKQIVSIATILLGLIFQPLTANAGGAFVEKSTSSAEATTDRIIVRYKNTIATPSEITQIHALVQDAISRKGHAATHVRSMSSGGQVWSLPRHIPLSEARLLAREIVKADQRILYSEPDILLQPTLVPNDPLYANQWHYFEPTAGINAQTAWDTSRGAGIVVAVIDTGIRQHSDLVANIVAGYDFISNISTANDGNGRDSDPQDPGDGFSTGECGVTPGRASSWHGTHVAGTIAATTQNYLGVAGVAFDSFIQPVRVLGKCGGYTSDIADGIIWASGATVPGVPVNATPARIINLSLGGLGACSATFNNAISVARTQGALVIAAAGNETTNVSNFTPANCPNVVSVAALSRGGIRSSFSNYGSSINIAAPGEQVYSTLNTGASAPAADSYAYYQGTSMAAPHVSGTAALVWSRKPTLTAAQVRDAITSTARSIANCSCGAGLLNAAAAANSVVANTTTATIEGPSGSYWFWDPTPRVIVRVSGSNPQGNVTFYSWNREKVTIPLVNGVASIPANTFSEGSNGGQYSISAVYRGSTTHAASRTGSVMLDVVGD